jgi:serine/threonine protein kinase/sugar lactone lactonase YvrE
MTPERWQQICDLLDSAMALEPAQRRAYLDHHCSGDPSLRKDVDSLLAAEHDLHTSFLESPAVAQAVLERNTASEVVWAAGMKLGPYEIQSLLGAGGMGEVYRARDTRLDRTVAIKVLPAHLSSDALRRQRFEREARAISALQHPNICTLYDVGRQKGTDYLVMEYLQGEPLAARLAKGPLPLDHTLRYGTEVADALDAAHRRGIVHRDLTPGNIFLTAHGECKVLDFGLAKLDKADSWSHVPGRIGPIALTSAGQVLGTAPFMSPEQVRGTELDSRTDLFSLGVVLYVMSTRTLPFPGDTSRMIFEAILERTPTPPMRLNPDLPSELERIIQKALEKDPELRYQRAAELLIDLQRLKRATDAGHRAASTVGEQGRKLTWKILASTISIVVALIAGALYWSSHKRMKLTYSIGPPTPCPGITSTVVVPSIPFFGGQAAGIALDRTGTLYIAENPFLHQGGTPGVLMVSADGAAQALLSPPGGFGDVTAVAFHHGNVYVADGIGVTNYIFKQRTALNTIWRWNPPSNTWGKVVTGVNNPTGLAFSNEDLYVSSFGDGKVFAYDPTGKKLGAVWTAPDSSALPYGLTFDQNGNLFIAGFGQTGNGTKIYKVAAPDVTAYTGNSSVFFNPGIIEPASLAFDTSGNLYASYYDSFKIIRIAPDGSSLEFRGGETSAIAPNGLAINHQNDLFTVTNRDAGGAVLKLHGLVDCAPTTPKRTSPLAFLQHLESPFGASSHKEISRLAAAAKFRL